MIALPVTCPTFIGREAELAALNDARRDLAKSRGAFVTISGDAGIGKSRLVAQFVARIGDRRVRNFASVECAQHSAESFRPIRMLLEALSESDRPSGLTRRAERAVASLASDDRAQVIDRAELFDGVVDFLAACAAKRSTILVIEDVHWADASSLQLFAYLAARIERMRLLVIVTCRAEGMTANALLLEAFARIEREPAHRRIALEPFGREAVRSLLVSALDGRASVDDSILSTIAIRSEGNAFFAEELLKDSLASRTGGARDLPISIRGLFAERFVSLAPAAQRVVSTAAVVGTRFEPQLLAQILSCSIDDLIEPLQAARDAAIVVEDPDRRGALRFRHALIRDSMYGALLIFDLQRLHQRILEVLEAMPDAPLYALAEHAAAAGDRRRTLQYGERAGETSWARGGYAEAIESFERALAASDDVIDRARIMERLAFPVSYTGDVRRMTELWERVLALHLQRGAYTEAARLHILLVCAHFNDGTMDDEGAAVLAFLAEHGTALTPLQRDRINVLVACLRSELAHLEAVQDLLASVESASLPADVAQHVVLANLNRAAFDGDVATWLARLDDLTSLTGIHENASVEALNVTDHLASVVVSALYLGVNAEIESSLERGRALAIEWKFDQFVSHYDALEAAYLCTRGRFADAAGAFRTASDATLYLTSSVLARTAPWLALALDDEFFLLHAANASVIERERQALRSNPHSQHSRLLLGGYALCRARHDRADAADDLRTAFAGIEEPSPRFAVLLVSAVRDGWAGELPTLALFARSDALRASDSVGHATAIFARAVIDREPASFGRAADRYERAGFPFLAAHAFHLAGMLDEARVLYARCGATAFLAERSAVAATKSERPELSLRELDVARGVAQGLSNLEISEQLGVSKKTVEKYLTSAFRKYSLRSRSQLAARLRDRL